MTTLRTAVSAAAAVDPDDDQSPEANLGKAYRLIAKTPQVIATYQRLRTGSDAIEPRDDLGIAANFLYALTGKEPDAGRPRLRRRPGPVRRPHPERLHLRRPGGRGHPGRHARRHRRHRHPPGPPARWGHHRVREMLEEISTDRAPEWVPGLARKEKVMGFGHRVYKTWDPRATILRGIAERLGQHSGEARW